MFFNILQALWMHDDAKTWLKFKDSSSSQITFVICKISAGNGSQMDFHLVYFERTTDQFMIAQTRRNYFHKFIFWGSLLKITSIKVLELRLILVGVDISCFSPKLAEIDLFSLWSDGTR